MKLNFLSHFRSYGIALFGVIVMAASAQLRAVDISGVYESTGVIVNAEAGTAGRDVSFRGLLGLELNLALANKDVTASTQVTIDQSKEQFSITCKDADGKTTWTGTWNRGAGYDSSADRVILLFRGNNIPGDGYLFALNNGASSKFLEVEILRIDNTLLGPVNHSIGSFVFCRIPAK